MANISAPSPASQGALLAALGDEVLGAAQLMERLGCSQPSLSRLVRAAGSSVLTLGKAKQTRYARARRESRLGFAARLEQPLAVTRIDAAGQAQACGELHTVGVPSGSRTVWTAHRQLAVHDGLPWWVADMRPAGFLGRQFPQRAGAVGLGLPPSVSDWGDGHVLLALSAAGFDEPGDVLLGRGAMDAWLRSAAPVPIALADKAHVYAQLADSASQHAAGSSAGGEQAKFTAYAEISRANASTQYGAATESTLDSNPDSNHHEINSSTAPNHGHAAHVIVKFSPTGHDPIAQRWRDLLRCEFHALRTLEAHAPRTGLQASRVQLIEADRTYLEVQRFDRTGPRGRRAVVSLGALDDVFIGQRHNWVHTAQRLAQLRMLASADVLRIALAYAFGLLIHNTDMHFGNLALLHDGPASTQFQLAPIYDMLPMRFAPTAQGLRPDAVPPVLPTADVLQVWADAQALAREFWERVRGDGLVSAGFVGLVCG